ncbi:MAG: hypothetical protein V4486_03675 [Patescibacteria group bacterium]
MDPRPDIPSTSERIKSKLEQLNPEELIPRALINVPGVKGDVKIIANKERKGISFVIFDEDKVGEKEHIKGFEYFYNEDEAEYPVLKVGPNEYSRILVHGTISELSPTILFGSMLETNPKFRGKGLGLAFTDNLITLAKKMGYRFFAGHHNDAKVAKFFLNRGRYLIEEVKPELQKEFADVVKDDPDLDIFHTVQFINKEDINTYIRPERASASVEDRISYKLKIVAVSSLLHKLSFLLDKVIKNYGTTGDKATLIEIIQDLSKALPNNKQSDELGLSEDDKNLLPILSELINKLKTNTVYLAENLTSEEIQENIKALP